MIDYDIYSMDRTKIRDIRISIIIFFIYPSDKKSILHEIRRNVSILDNCEVSCRRSEAPWAVTPSSEFIFRSELYFVFFMSFALNPICSYAYEGRAPPCRQSLNVPIEVLRHG